MSAQKKGEEEVVVRFERGTMHLMILLRGEWRVVFHTLGHPRKLNSSMSKAQISGYCKRLWEVHHSLRTRYTLHLLLLLRTHIHIVSPKAHISEVLTIHKSTRHTRKLKTHIVIQLHCHIGRRTASCSRGE